MKLPITREEESRLPAFTSYEDARAYFSERFGSAFILQDIDDVGEQQCYFHALIIDREKFESGQRHLREHGSVTGIDYISSHQPVQIMQDGSVHVVY